MDVYRTEEEQIEAIKRWWKENGSTILVTLVVVLVVLFGWRIWKDHDRTIGEAASTSFQDLLDASQKLAINQQTFTKDSIEVKSVETLGQIVIDEHADTDYAIHANLLLAKKSVIIGDYESAERQLKEILRGKHDKSLTMLTRYRLAKVLLARGNYEESLSTLSVNDAGAFSAAYEELKGDIYVKSGDQSKARLHYKNALAIVTEGGQNGEGSTRPMLEIKYHDLAGVADQK